MPFDDWAKKVQLRFLEYSRDHLLLFYQNKSEAKFSHMPSIRNTKNFSNQGF